MSNNNMLELFIEARQYGLVYIHTHEDGMYLCKITFNTISHVKLEAISGHNCKCPKEAIEKAIKKAKEIVNSLSKGVEDLKRIGK